MTVKPFWTPECRLWASLIDVISHSRKDSNVQSIRIVTFWFGKFFVPLLCGKFKVATFGQFSQLCCDFLEFCDFLENCDFLWILRLSAFFYFILWLFSDWKFFNCILATLIKQIFEHIFSTFSFNCWFLRLYFLQFILLWMLLRLFVEKLWGQCKFYFGQRFCQITTWCNFIYFWAIIPNNLSSLLEKLFGGWFFKVKDSRLTIAMHRCTFCLITSSSFVLSGVHTVAKK